MCKIFFIFTFFIICYILYFFIQIQSANGEVAITNDGATILKQMNVIHPAAKMVISYFLLVKLAIYFLGPFIDIKYV